MELLKKMRLQVKSCNKKQVTSSPIFSTIASLILKKNKLIIAVTLSFSLNATTQITIGNWRVGGSSRFYNIQRKVENTSSTGLCFGLRPIVGCFIKCKLALELAPLLSHCKPDRYSPIFRCSMAPFANLTPCHYFYIRPLFTMGLIGLTDFTLDKKTGQITQVGEKNTQPDRLLKTDSKGKVKKKGKGFFGFLVRKSERGKVMVELDNIEQGILKEGMNLKENDNLIQVGGKGQASVKGFEDFALQFSNYIGREIVGEYFSEKGQSAISYLSIGRYNFNTATSAAGGIVPTRFKTDLNVLQTLQLRVHYHTHLSMYKDSDRTTPSKADLSVRASLPFGVKSIIITNPKTIDYSSIGESAIVYGSISSFEK
jgi:hypothetical protein